MQIYSRDLRVGDIVVHGLCVLAWVDYEVSSDAWIVVDGEDPICNLQVSSSLVRLGGQLVAAFRLCCLGRVAEELDGNLRMCVQEVQ
jgi:hypothetical protein